MIANNTSKFEVELKSELKFVVRQHEIVKKNAQKTRAIDVMRIIMRDKFVKLYSSSFGVVL